MSGLIIRKYRGEGGAFNGAAWGTDAASMSLMKLAHDIDTLVDDAHPLPAKDTAAIGVLSQILGGLPHDPATETTLAAALAKLQGSIAVTGPLTAAQLGLAALMTDAKGELIRLLLAGLATGKPADPTVIREKRAILDKELVRANSTAAYAISQAVAGDVVNSWLFTFDLGPSLGGQGILDRIRLLRDTPNQFDTPFRAYVYDADVPQLADHAAFNLSYLKARRGYVDFMAPLTLPGDAPTCTEIPGLINGGSITLKPADGIVRIGLVTTKAYTPSAGGDRLMLIPEFRAVA